MGVPAITVSPGPPTGKPFSRKPIRSARSDVPWKVNRRGLLYGLALGIAATIAMVVLALALGSPDLLIFLFPSLFLWLLIPVFVATMVRRRRAG